MRDSQKRRSLPTLDTVRSGVLAEVRFIINPAIRYRLAALGLRQGDQVIARARVWSGIQVELDEGKQIIIDRRSAGCVLVAVQEPHHMNSRRVQQPALMEL